MAYSLIPQNINDIAPYVHEYSSYAQEKIINASKVFVIDTCSFQFFMNADRPEFFADYVAQNSGCIIVFRTILMEMAGDRASLDAAQINLFKVLKDKNIEVFILYEEDLKDLLQVYTDTQRINSFLKFAVACMKGTTGLLHQFMSSHKDIEKAVFSDTSAPDLYSRFWTALRNMKTHGDNLGEYACILCIHILSNIEDIHLHKFVFLTEDKPAIVLLSKAIINARRHHDSDLIGCATSSKVVAQMYHSKILKCKKDIIEFYKPLHDEHFVRVSVNDIYAIEPLVISFTIDDLADYICGEKGQIVI